jgi:hypothetical protein
MVAALGRMAFVNQDALATMPTDGPDEGELHFFFLQRDVLVAEYEAELKSRGLAPHPLAQIQVNVDYRTFADEHSNGVQWKSGCDHPGCMKFERWTGERRVHISYGIIYWVQGSWLAGVPL